MSEPLSNGTDLNHIRSEVQDLRFVIRLTWNVIILVMGYFSTHVCFMVPFYAKVFEDMLGDASKLPLTTKLLIAWSQAGGGVLAPAVSVLLTLFCLILPWSLSSIRQAALGSFVGGGFLIVFTLLAWNALFSPLGAVLQALSGGGQ